MTILQPTLCTLLVSLFVQIPVVQAQPISGPEESLIQVNGNRWLAGMNLGFDRRSFEIESRDEDFDLVHLWAHLGFEPHPAIQLRAELGSSKAENDIDDGETGLRAGGALRAGLAQLPLDSSPTLGDLSQLRLGGEFQYRFVESNFADGDFNYEQYGGIVDISYDRNLRDQARFGLWRSAGTSWRAGLAWLESDGEFGLVDVAAERNFALELGVSHGWTSRWVSSLEGRFFSSEDRELWLSTSVRF